MAIGMYLYFNLHGLEIRITPKPIPVTNLFSNRPTVTTLLNPVMPHAPSHNSTALQFMISSNRHKLTFSDSIRSHQHDRASSSVSQEFFNVIEHCMKIILRTSGSPTAYFGLLKVHLNSE